MNENYIFEDNGEVVMATSSSVPGIMIVPAGKTVEDAKPVTHEHFKQLLEQREADALVKETKRSQEAKDLTKLVASLQADIEALKAKGK